MNKSIIVLHQFPISKKAGVPNYSPFCTKLETYLKIRQLPYEIKDFTGNPKNAPKGKLPFIDYGEKRYDDSELIIQMLENEGEGLDHSFSGKEKGIITATKKLLEQHLLPFLLHFRWGDDQNWIKTREVFFRGLPSLIRKPVSAMVRKGVVKALWAEGTGRYTLEEKKKMMEKAFEALDQLKEEGPYFMGERASTLDAAAFGTLSNILFTDLQPEIKKIMEKYPRLTSYTKDLEHKYYPKQ
jgi:glutathione S-transferase